MYVYFLMTHVIIMFLCSNVLRQMPEIRHNYIVVPHYCHQVTRVCETG